METNASFEPKPIDLAHLKEELKIHIHKDFKKYISDDNTITEIKYPVIKYPKKKKFKIGKHPIVEGLLLE